MASNLPIRFKVSPVTLQKESFDSRLIVKKPIRFIRYGGIVPNDSVGISYVGLKPVSQENILLLDLGNDTITNSDIALEERTVENIDFRTAFRDVLVTDLSINVPTREPIPLFYKHDLSNETAISEIKVFDKNQREVDDNYWLYDSNLKTIYHNLPTFLDEDTGEFEIYTLSYIDASLERKSVLLNVSPAYTRHDIAQDGAPDPNKRTYTANDNGANWDIHINYAAAANKIFIKGIRGSQVRPILPAETDPDSQWRMRFTRGQVYVTKGGVPRRYSVPEWDDQIFLPIAPYKYAAYKEAKQITNRVVQTTRYPLHMDAENALYINILITDELGRAKRGYTDNPNLAFWNDEDGRPTEIRMTQISNTDISISRDNGFIRLGTEIEPTDKVIVSHYYKEEYLEYLGYDFNPVYNSQALGRRVIFYARPDVPDVPGNKAIYHIALNEVDMTTVEYNDPQLSLLNNSTDINDLSGVNKTYTNFIEANPNLLLLASVDIAKRSAPQDVVKIDTRVRGGGLRKGVNPAPYYGQYPEVGFFADIANWDGRPYPGMVASYIELPHHLITGKGTLKSVDDLVLTEAEVKELVKKHMALGAYPVIKWYGHRAKILSVSYTSLLDTSITVTWSAVPGATGYKLYWANNVDDHFTEGASVTLPETTLTGLPVKGTYLYVTPLFDGNEGLKSDMIHVDPSRVDPANVSATADAVLVSGVKTVTITIDQIIT